ncbi:hypothetical protein [Nannocystis punicea]|uniref:Tetratricopeptide repeat protein n=1 Tax=Nannocystis punicea TaxID=2995304 RepID=A0ABY7GXD6_9BACT|nr:hypothetical protein [Nannocystis poenicansa]WAS91479.1 hypothetical protein O0S08_35295 [Nannocystis poenicansa]
MRRLALLVALAGACKPTSTGTATPAEATTQAPRRVDPELTAMADRIDPGPQAPLYEVLPAWLKSKVDAALTGDPKSPKLIAEAREAIAAVDKIKPGDPQSMLQGGFEFARGVLLAERAVTAGSDDPELLAALTTAYRVVHDLQMFQGNGLFGQMLNLAAELARKEAKAESAQIEEALAALKIAVARAPALQMHATARLLREHPDHPTVPPVLVRAGQVKMEVEQYEDAVALGKLAVARKGEKASGSDFAGLTMACARGLDVACADMARKTAEARGPDGPGEDKAAAFEKRLAELDEAVAIARKALVLAASPELEPQLERGHLLLKLGRLSDAEKLFTALREANPTDARPVTGQAVAAVRRNLDLVTVVKLVRWANDLDHRDRLYYEVALGTVPVVMIGEVATQMAQTAGAPLPDLQDEFAEVLQLTAAYRWFDPARAAVLELLFTTAQEAVPKILSKQRDASLAGLRKLSEKALALTRKFPESRDAWRLVFSGTRLLNELGKVRALVTAPLPPALQQDPDIRLQQVRAQLDAALFWEDAGLLATAEQSAATLPNELDADTAATIRATIDAVKGRQGDKAALQRAVDAFAALAERKTGKEQSTAYNNAAMIVAHASEVETAMAILQRAHEAANDELTPAYNMSALAFGLQARDGLPEMFAKIVQYSQVPGLRLHAQAWLVALADAGLGDVAVTRQEFAAALDKEQGGSLRGRLPLGRWGVIDQSEFNVSLGYSTVAGLTLLDEVVSRWMLIVPAPTMEALVGRSKAKPGKPAAPAKPSR